MTRVVYVGGRYVAYAQAGVHVEDRGFQFADAVYEVIEVRDRLLIDGTRHLARLWRSLDALEIMPPMGERALRLVIAQIIRRNRVDNGIVYLQVTRGAAPRDFAFPPADTPATLVCLARRTDRARIDANARSGIAVITVPDNRWERCDIKTTMLLPGSLAKMAAARQGGKEAWLVDRQGFVTEGASSTAWIVDASGRLVTRALGSDILPGITRRTLLDVIAAERLEVIEAAFTPADAVAAAEAFYTSASSTVMPVVRIDGHIIGDGHPGQITRRLRARFHQLAEAAPPLGPCRRPTGA
ncbi:MAG: D-amino-acid transaminase [Hyphomicrobiaceae bacterium]|nr:D-amino-acid transaminase [Hyphomicrobiaceae bacterium]